MNVFRYECISWRDTHMYQNSAVFKRRESVLVYGLATISRLLKIAGLFCRIQSLLQGSFAEETYNFKEPTN